MSNKQDNSVAVLLILISAFWFSVYPILGKVVFAGGAGLSTVLLFRFGISALTLWAITIWREGFPRLSLKSWLSLWLMGGVAYSMMAGLYISSVLYIPASLAALLLYAYPIIVTVLAVLTKQEMFSRFKFAGLIIATFGLVLVLGVAFQGINILGVLLALGAAFVYAIYILAGNKVLKTISPLVSTAAISTSAALTYGVIGFQVSGMTWNLSWGTWMGIVGIAVSTIIAMLTFFEGIKRVGATSASIISTTEPVMTVILAVIIFQEHLTLWQVVGGIFVIAGGILAVISPASKIIRPVNSSVH
ncbi:EamA family transporter [Desulfosporosinus youngiae]|nr:DMT family transporter [Desulfosporosinus youngiae]